jgi:uncharacterized membrane protein (UPF0182 family)
MGEQVMQTRQDALASMQQTARQAQAAAPGQVEELQRAQELIREARTALQDGDFASFGDRFNELEQVLNDIPLPDTTNAAPTTPASGAPTSETGMNGGS